MKKRTGYAALPLVLMLALSQLFFIAPVGKAESRPMNEKSDLVIFQNIPEAETGVKDGKFRLKAIRAYTNGTFMEAGQNLIWQSTNSNVAEVDGEGNVVFNGKRGRTFITVTDGVFTDRIALDFKTVPGKKGAKPFIVKQRGERYQLIQRAVSKMPLEHKIGQMLMPDFRTWKGMNVTELNPEIEQLVKKYHLGGVILFRENVVTTEQTARLVSQYNEASENFGLLMSIDQEGGIVTRLQSGTDMPGNMALGAARSPELAWSVGNSIGEELAALGINTNFAPVMDINNNPDNPVIGVRSFGENPELVGSLGVAYTKGLQDAGVAATAKHFPGHGDTEVDSHLGLPEVPHDRDRLKKVELYPFQKAMEAGIDAIMTAHVTFPKIDSTKAISKKTGEEIAVPATLSYKVLTELMREDMGYEGVITTDAMNMKAIADHFGAVDAAVRAVKAGTDIVLMPVRLEEVAEGLLKAAESGEISEDRIDRSVSRVLTLKIKRGILKQETPQPVEETVSEALRIVGSPQHKSVEKEAAEKSITVARNENALPLKLDDDDEVVVVGNTYISDMAKAVKKRHANIHLIATSSYVLTDEQREWIRHAKAVIAGTYTFNVAGRSPDSPQMKMVREIAEISNGPVIGVAIRNPYDIMAYPAVDAYLAQYGFRTASFEASAGAIFGEFSPSGKLPVTIPAVDGTILYPFGHGLSY
ncbi:glycoside hydrolase family 3 protein [Mesobacillus zeae]|uniref:glycoside hydrolase family 3 protein n=1 Tax=Mesobacillus zeae TaxID=1917180 RepID=UPI00300BC5A5